MVLPQIIRKLPPCYGSRRFITVFTKAHNLLLSCVRLTLSTFPILFIEKNFIIFRLTLGLPSCFLLQGSLSKFRRVFSLIPYTCPTHLVLLDFFSLLISRQDQTLRTSSLYSFTQPLLGLKHSPQHPILENLNL